MLCLSFLPWNFFLDQGYIFYVFLGLCLFSLGFLIRIWFWIRPCTCFASTPS
jgi:hypothetical protein